MAYLAYQPRSTLFHYTSTEGFTGIASSKKLWLSDIRQSNDPRELTLALDLMKSAIRSDDISAQDRIFITELLDSVDYYRAECTLYACSFGLKGDEMPMWREYSSDYSGLCIGFRPTAVEAITGRMQLVRYIEDDISSYIKSSLLEISRQMGKQKSIMRAIAASEVICIATSIKHRTWKYEKEARIIFSQRNTPPDPVDAFTKYVGENADGTVVEWEEPQVRFSGDREIKYRAFSFGRRRQGKVDARKAIEVVYTGPKCAMSNAEVEEYLRNQGFEEFKVLSSECEVR